jgi:hypothetical protein
VGNVANASSGEPQQKVILCNRFDGLLKGDED